MNTKQFKEFVRDVYQTKVGKAVAGVGPAGIGKSQIVQQVAREEGVGYVDLRPAQQEVGDLIGLPREENGVTVWSMPSWMKYLQECKNGAILCIEEPNRGTKDVRQAMFQLFTDRKMHTHTLPKNVAIILLMNPSNENYDVSEEVDCAWIRRMCWVKVLPDYTQWKEYATKVLNINGDIVAWLDSNRHFLYKEELFELPKVSYNPDAISDMNKFMSAGLLSGKKYDNYEVAQGLVGIEAALSFKNYMETKQNPVTGEEIIKNWSTDKNLREKFFKQRNDEISTTLESFVTYVNNDKRKLSKEHWTNTFQFWYEQKPDHGVMLWKELDQVKLDEFMTKQIGQKENKDLGIEKDIPAEDVEFAEYWGKLFKDKLQVEWGVKIESIDNVLKELKETK